MNIKHVLNYKRNYTYDSTYRILYHKKILISIYKCMIACAAMITFIYNSNKRIIIKLNSTYHIDVHIIQ